MYKYRIDLFKKGTQIQSTSGVSEQDFQAIVETAINNPKITIVDVNFVTLEIMLLVHDDDLFDQVHFKMIENC